MRGERQQVLFIAEPPLQLPLCHFKSFSVYQVCQQELKKAFGGMLLFVCFCVCMCVNVEIPVLGKVNNKDHDISNYKNPVVVRMG